jgi:hypothetical protein
MTRVVIPEPADAMETIRHLRAELQSVLEREAATHALHDARVEALEARIAALRAMPAPVSILGEHDGVLPDDVYNILTKTEPAAPVTVQTVLSNPLKDRGKMIKPFPGAPAGGYPPPPVDASQGRETDCKPSVDLTPEAVERLAKRLQCRANADRAIQRNNEAVAAALRGQRILFDEGFRSPSNTFAVRLQLDYENCAKHDAKLVADWEEAAATLRALSERLAEVEAERDVRIDPVHVEGMIKSAEPMLVEAYEAELATARADAALIAELVEALESIATKSYYAKAGNTAQTVATAALAKMNGDK